MNGFRYTINLGKGQALTELTPEVCWRKREELLTPHRNKELRRVCRGAQCCLTARIDSEKARDESLRVGEGAS